MASTDPEFLLGMQHTNMRTVGFDEYDAFVRDTAIFKADRGIQYCLTKLAGEVGEFNEKIASIVSNQCGFTDAYFTKWCPRDVVEALIRELGDITWYCAALSQQFGYSFPLMRGVHPDPIRYQDGIGVLTVSLRMSGLVGTISEKAGKIIRDQDGDGTNTSFAQHHDFTGGSLRTLSTIIECVERLARFFDHNIETVIATNVEKLESRRNRGVLKGSGDNR